MKKHKKNYSILEFGAKPNGSICTSAIQKAIDTCFLNGGGRVIIPFGNFLTGCIRIRSNVTIYLKKGAVLKGSINPEDYLSFLGDKLEPILEEDKKTVYSSMIQTRSVIPCSRWNNAIIRGIRAQNIAVIGEKGSVIDGQNCYDEQGEEQYRGPHAINLWFCENVKLFGYTIKDSANWAHAIQNSKNIVAEKLIVFGGHDGFDIRTCDDVIIKKCKFFSGDDCIAGFDNINVHIYKCYLNCACSNFRLGGTNILIEKCKGVSPSLYGFRGHLTLEEKKDRVATNEKCRHFCHHFFQYYCDERAMVRQTPGKVIIRKCRIENVETIFELNYGSIWCNNRSLNDISFKKCNFINVGVPININAPENESLLFNMSNCKVSAKEKNVNFMVVKNCSKICLYKMTLDNFNQPTIKSNNKENIRIAKMKGNVKIIDID